jgi:general secretion pathway protein D
VPLDAANARSSMKKYRGFLIIAGVMAGFFAQAEMVITSPTGLPDENDVVLKKAVDSVKDVPADTVAVIGDTAAFVADELRNTAHGVASAFEGESLRERAKQEMLLDVTRAWNASGEIQMRTFTVSEALGKEFAAGKPAEAAFIDVHDFFKSVAFPAGTAAEYWPERNRLIVHQTSAGMLDVIQILAVIHNQKAEYRQVEIQTKFIEVEQKALNELGFDWNFHSPGQLKLGDNWTADLAGQTLAASGVGGSILRSAATALPGAAAAGTMTLTKGGWMPLDLVIKALEQSSGAEMLSAPSLTTQDGAPAEIWVGDREMMPTSFTPGSRNTSVCAAYAGWKEKNIGVRLKVTPEIVEKNLINLALNPEVIDLVGYDTYRITPGHASMMVWAGYPTASMAQTGRYPIPNVPGINSAWNLIRATLGGKDPNDVKTGVGYSVLTGTNSANISTIQKETVSDGYFDSKRTLTYEEWGVPVPQVTGSLPVFRVRKIETSMTVADGNTVGMGGLIYDKLETYKDKVPVLGSIPLIGRLFRSEGQRSVKRNLMIFVTATQVDVNGRRSSDVAAR